MDIEEDFFSWLQHWLSEQIHIELAMVYHEKMWGMPVGPPRPHSKLCNREMAVPPALCQFGGPTIQNCVLELGHDGICWAGTMEDYQKYLNKEYPWNK